MTQDFMTTMATLSLFQLISTPMHTAGHTLGLVFSGGYRDNGLIMEQTKVTVMDRSLYGEQI